MTTPAENIGTAEAKRRFSQLVDRVGEGESFVVSRRGKPVVAFVPPTADLLDRPGHPPSGLAAVAGALAEWDELDDVVAEIYASRGTSTDRPAPDLG
ncbi:MAG: type II toxin-antitoxin system Phd/YefM family antitoxin [Solirubrobacterales bacterium]